MKEIRTTNGKLFGEEDHKTLARLVYRRFGEDLQAAAEAWSRLLQNSTGAHEFSRLLDLATPS